MDVDVDVVGWRMARELDGGDILSRGSEGQHLHDLIR